MNTTQIDNVSAGYVFVYDEASGRVLWTHEKMVELPRGRETAIAGITPAECEQVRAEAARVFSGRRVKALIAPQGFALSENAQVFVDPKTQALRTHTDEIPDLAMRFAGGKGNGASPPA